MGVTAAIIGATAAVGGTVATISAQKKAAKEAKKQTAAITANAPDPMLEGARANIAASSAAVQQKRRGAAAAGYRSTILTGPSGTNQPAPTATKTLLGM